MRLVLWIAALLLLSAVCSTFASDDRLPVPLDAHYYQPVSTVYGTRALWLNPAGLSRARLSGAEITADITSDGVAKSWGSVILRDRIATGFRRINNPEGDHYNELMFGAGFGIGRKLSLGLSYRYFTSGPSFFNDRHFWTVGLQSRLSRQLAVGAVWENLNRGRIEGERTAVSQKYSLAWRPMGEKLTIAAQMDLSTRQKLDEAQFIYSVNLSPTRGLYLTANIDNDRNFEFGIRTNLLKYFTGFQSSYDRKAHHRRTTVYTGMVNIGQPSILPPPSRRVWVTTPSNASENPPRPVFGSKSVAWVDFLLDLHRITQDPSVEEVIIRVPRASMGFGRAQELRREIEKLKLAGKNVDCYLDNPGNLAYYIGSAANRIFIPPVCQVNLIGLRAELTFYAETLEKVGVDLDMMRIGDHKTAPETWTRSESTEANREQTNRLLDDWYQQFVGSIAEGRGLAPDSVTQIIDNGPFTSGEALEFGLVDACIYADELSKPGEDSPELLRPLSGVSLQRFVADSAFRDEWEEPPAIGIVVAEGDIEANKGTFNPLSSSAKVTPSLMKRAFAEASHDANIKSLVFRINSPGGWALAGEAIHHEATRAARHKPLVVSIANVAASGGYHVAMSGGTLVANPASVTGSIGIYGGKLNLHGLYQKLAVGKELYTRGRFAGILTNIRPFTEEEREKYFAHMKAFYDHFVSLVAENRGLTADSVDALGQGRVWTGREAQENGLVDGLGGLQESLALAAERAGLERYRVELLPRKRPLFLLPGKGVISSLGQLFGLSHVVPDVEATESLLTHEEGLWTRMPFDIEVQ